MHYIEEFKRSLAANHAMLPRHSDAMRLARWMLDDGLPLYEKAFHQETKKGIPCLAEDKLIEQAYPDGMNDADRKLAQFGYYGANARVFINVCRDIANVIINVPEDTQESQAIADHFAPNHIKLLHALGFDAIFLLEEWAVNMQQTSGAYGVGKNMQHCAFQISHAAEKMAYGWSPFFAYNEIAVEASTALIRVCIETRLRFGFGVLGIEELATGAILPLNLSALFKAIEVHGSSVKFPVSLSHIKRIYGWSNIYVHLGLKDYVWSPIFALKYLCQFLRGGETATGMSIYAGIETDSETLRNIQAEARSEAKLDPSSQSLITIDAKDCSVINQVDRS